MIDCIILDVVNACDCREQMANDQRIGSSGTHSNSVFSILLCPFNNQMCMMKGIILAVLLIHTQIPRQFTQHLTETQYLFIL